MESDQNIAVPEIDDGKILGNDSTMGFGDTLNINISANIRKSTD
jgi:hypothetical protein